jgi:uncharacterized membrane protein SpoIIM required for sporulation
MIGFRKLWWHNALRLFVVYAGALIVGATNIFWLTLLLSSVIGALLGIYITNITRNGISL